MKAPPMPMALPVIRWRFEMIARTTRKLGASITMYGSMAISVNRFV
jgi:hypothetical protein